MGNSIYFSNRYDGTTLLLFTLATALIALVFLLPWLWNRYQSNPKRVTRRFTRKGRALGLLQNELQQLLDGLLELNRVEQAMLLLKDYDFMEKTLRQMGKRQWSKKGKGAIACYRLFRILEKLSLHVLQNQHRRQLLKPGGSVVYLVSEEGVRLKFTLARYRSGYMQLMAPRSVQEQIPLNQRQQAWSGKPCSLLLFGLGRNGQVAAGQGLIFRAVPGEVRSQGQLIYLHCNQVQQRNDVQLAVRRFQRRYAPEVKVLLAFANQTHAGRLLNLSTRGCALLLNHSPRPTPPAHELVLQLTLPNGQAVTTKAQLCSISTHRQQRENVDLFHLRFLELSRATYLLLASYVYRYDLELEALPAANPRPNANSWVINSPQSTTPPSNPKT